MKLLSLLACMLFSTACPAQKIRSSRSAGYMGLGSYSLQFTDVFSFTGNQASLSRTTSLAAGVYSEKRFLLQQMKQFSGVISFPCWQGGAGISAEYAGFSQYSEKQAGIAYGRAIGEKVDVGIQFNYHHINIAGYGSAGTVDAEAGIILHLTDKIHAGCHVVNPAGGNFSKSPGEKLASIYSFAMGYEASEKLFIATEVNKEENQSFSMNFFMQYAFVKQVFVRGGIGSAPETYFFGTGTSWKNYRVDVAATWHPLAGWTPSLLLVFQLKPLKTEQ